MMMTLSNPVRQQPGMAMMLTLQSAMRPQLGQGMFHCDSMKLEHPDQVALSLLPSEALTFTASGGYDAAEVQSAHADAEVMLAEAHQEYNAFNYEGALQHCLVVYHRSSERTGVLLLLGAVYYQLKPDFCDAWSILASAYMRKGMLQEAADCCRHALSMKPATGETTSTCP